MSQHRATSRRLLVAGLIFFSVLTVADTVFHFIGSGPGRDIPVEKISAKSLLELFIIVGQILLCLVAWWLVIRRRTDEKAISSLHDELKLKTVELEESNHDLESFCYSVSHDLRSHLARINGFAQLILEAHASELSGVCREYFDRVVSAGKDMDEMLDGLLTLSRLGRTHLELTNVDLSELVQVILAERIMAESQRAVDYVIVPGQSALCDGRLMRIALENLISNALKFTAKRERAVIEFGVQNADQGLVWFIRDNGAGFSPEDAERIFQPFQRGHSEAEFPGNGIGLATVHRIIKLHGGRIWAEGEVDRGASFYFTM